MENEINVLASSSPSNVRQYGISRTTLAKWAREGSDRIGSQTARQMVTWAHYRFQQRLLFKCRQHNCRVAIADESYTSKTCSACGALDYKLGGKKVYRCASCKMVMDRDINGAKNISLKNFEALALELALGPTPCTLETECCTEQSCLC